MHSLKRAIVFLRTVIGLIVNATSQSWRSSRERSLAAALSVAFSVALSIFITSDAALAQTPATASSSTSANGEALFKAKCTVCHSGATGMRAPPFEVLKQRSAGSILNALSNGAMRVQGSDLSGEQRREIAEYVSGQELTGDATGATTGLCVKKTPFKLSAPIWSGWSPDLKNDRFQTAQASGLTAAQVPQLKLQWAFGFPDATSSWATPAVAGNRVFVGSQNGTVYSLDAKTGCIYWYYSADGGVRTGISIGERKGGAAIYFGDTNANAYALDAQSGRVLWKTKVEPHLVARITGTPALYRDRLYVPMSSYEESQMANRDYACCSFRGSVTSIDINDGHIVWQAYVIPDVPKERVTKTGRKLWGPSGAAIWSAPTIDVKRGLVYAATGNGYTGPYNAASDAVVAIELASGKIAWTKQLHEKDVYLGGCLADTPNPDCNESRGPDFDFGNSPILAKLPNGQEALVLGQKSGVGWAIDPDKQGAVLWQYRAGKGGALGGMEWGSAVDAEHAYFPVSDMSSPTPGGLHAVNLQSGERDWLAMPPPPTTCKPGRGCNSAQPAAITVIPGVVFSGAIDGVLRAYSTKDGEVIWQADTNGDFKAVNGVAAKGASIVGPGATVAGGMVYVPSGYGAFGGRPGNVLLAYGLDSTKSNSAKNKSTK